jgi:hypothetical protein
MCAPSTELTNSAATHAKPKASKWAATNTVQGRRTTDSFDNFTFCSFVNPTSLGTDVPRSQRAPAGGTWQLHQQESDGEGRAARWGREVERMNEEKSLPGRGLLLSARAQEEVRQRVGRRSDTVR